MNRPCIIFETIYERIKVYVIPVKKLIIAHNKFPGYLIIEITSRIYRVSFLNYLGTLIADEKICISKYRKKEINKKIKKMK